MKAREEEARQFKIIILGAGECGKSTILKQLRMIFTVLVQSACLLREAANTCSSAYYFAVIRTWANHKGIIVNIIMNFRT